MALFTVSYILALITKFCYSKTHAKERLLILSPFESRYNRQTEALANRRNAFVAALADKICIVHAAEDSKTLEFVQMIVSWDKPVFTFNTPANSALFEFGVQSIERRWTQGPV